MYEALLDKLKTKEEVAVLEVEVEDLLANLYKITNDFDTTLKGSVRAWVYELVSVEISKSNVDKVKYFEDLKTELSKFKVLELTLAVEPNYSLIENIHDWLRQNIGKGIVIDVDYDSSVIAGSIISFNGHYLDLSLRKSFDEVFRASQDEILTVLNAHGVNSQK